MRIRAGCNAGGCPQCNPQCAARRIGDSRAAPAAVGRHGPCNEPGMIDLLLVLSTVAFFALAWGYARLCEKL